MADIIERGLNLQVEAEDLASATFSALADQLDDLQARAQSTFEAMAMSGADAASSLADSAGLFAPEWISELEALQQAADAAFAQMGASASSGATAMAGAASTVSDAWTTASTALKTDTDSAIGSLEGLEGQMVGAADTAETTSGEIADAYSADALGLDAADGSLVSLQGEFNTTAGVATEDAGTIAEAWGGDALSLDAGNGSLTALQGGFDETAGVATEEAGVIADAWSGDALSLDASVGSLETLQEQFSTTATDATESAGTIGEAFTSDSLGLDAAKGDLAALDSQMGTAAKDAQTAAGEITKAWGAVDLSGGGAAAAGAGAGAAGAGAGEGAAGAAAAGAAEGDVAGISFSKIPTPSLSTILTAGITTAIGLGAADIAMQQLEGLQAFQAITGMNWTKTLTTTAAAKGVGLSTDQIERMIQRLDTNIGKLTQGAVLGATAEGQPVSLGMGRTGVDPNTLKAVLNSLGGTGGAALAMKTLGLTPSQLSGMDAQQQLAVIAERLSEIKNNTLKTAVTQELFGKGTDTALMLQKFTTAEAEAQKNLPKGLAQDLKMTLGGGGDKSMIDLQENMFYLEVEMSASLMKMVPDLDKLVQFTADHTKLLEEIAVGILAMAGLKKGAGLVSDIEKMFGKAGPAGGWIARGGATDAATTAAFAGSAAIAADLIVKKITGSGYDLSQGTANDTSAFALAWQKLVAPHTGKGEKFTTADTEKAIAQAAAVFGLNTKAMLADSFAEAHLGPSALDKKSGATGALQFMPATWAEDTSKLLGEKLPLALANNPYIASFVAAASMKKGGIGGEKGDQSALLDMLKNFENPGAKGVQGDLTRGVPFLKQLEDDLKGGTGDKVKKATNDLLLTLVTDAQKHGKDFSDANDTMLKQTETYLKTHKGNFTTVGRELLQGLEVGLQNELPTLMGQAKKIATQLEAELKSALQTHSPSEMTAAMGEDLMAGLALGMQRRAPQTAREGAEAALQVVGAIGGTSTGGPAAAGGMQTIIIELDGKTLTQLVQRNMHQNTKLITKFN